MPKKISVNFSTLVDLKAELFRKQEQAQRQKDRGNEKPSSSLFVKTGKPILYESRKAATAREKLRRQGPRSEEQRRRLEEVEAATKEEELQLARSKERLAAKAALYEQLQSGKATTDSDGDQYLVNFERKGYDERKSDDDSDSEDNDTNPDGSDDWVEYTDVLGRTRKCLGRDLPEFMAADEKLKKRQGTHEDTAKASSTLPEIVHESSEMLSDDTRRELKRKAWEREEQEVASRTGPVHYQHLADGEHRELGAGYFPFSANEQTRQDQMRQLDDLRQQTISQRIRSQRLMEKRQAALKARLDKVMERKKLKEDTELPDFLKTPSDDNEDVYVSNLADIPLPSSSTSKSPVSEDKEIGPLPKPTAVRPWDVGKPKFGQEQWAEKRRQERSNEFGPPSFY